MDVHLLVGVRFEFVCAGTSHAKGVLPFIKPKRR